MIIFDHLPLKPLVAGGQQCAAVAGGQQALFHLGQYVRWQLEQSQSCSDDSPFLTDSLSNLFLRKSSVCNELRVCLGFLDWV